MGIAGKITEVWKGRRRGEAGVPFGDGRWKGIFVNVHSKVRYRFLRHNPLEQRGRFGAVVDENSPERGDVVLKVPYPRVGWGVNNQGMEVLHVVEGIRNILERNPFSPSNEMKARWSWRRQRRQGRWGGSENGKEFVPYAFARDLNRYWWERRRKKPNVKGSINIERSNLSCYAGSGCKGI